MKRLMTVLTGVLALGLVATSKAAEANSFEKDRKAILAMSGKFDVEFNQILDIAQLLFDMIDFFFVDFLSAYFSFLVNKYF